MKLTHKEFMNFIGMSLPNILPLVPNTLDFTVSVRTKGDYQEIELIVHNSSYKDYRYMWE